MKKEKININLQGREYLEFLKYKNENSLFNKFNKSKKETKVAIVSMLGIIMFTLILIMIIDILTSKPSQAIIYTWDGIWMFLAIMMGLAWLIHGFGFILIRR